MRVGHHHGGWTISLSFVIALILTMMPLPEMAEPFRPAWMILVLIYWCLAVPERVGVGIGWLMGLLLDVVNGALLGQYAIALAVIAYLTLHLHKRIRNFPLGQQALFIMFMVLIGQGLVLWIKGIIGQSPNNWLYWAPAITSGLLWPWVFLILRDLRRRFRVS
ncbi:MAG: rod shape-determining protein MreD [Gammaproteobacteria bacterium]|nr:rod shape-determining protein MreD [Gammaproteobacteria bacterium]